MASLKELSLTFLLLSFAAYALGWEATITARSDGGLSETVTFGTAEGATDGLDSVDVTAPPPPPTPPPLFIAFRIEVPVIGVLYLKKDMRAPIGEPGDEITWTLVVNAQDGLTLTWDISAIPPEYAVTLNETDMRTSSSLHLDLGTYTLTLAVRTNSPPWIDPPIPDITTDEDVPVTYDLTGHENDAEDARGDGPPLTWSVSGGDPNLFTASVDPNTDVLTITPVENAYGSATLTLILTDSGGATAQQEITITINPVNDPPWIEPAVPDITCYNGEPEVYDLTTHENDVEDVRTDGAPLTWSAGDVNPALFAVTVNPLTDEMTVTPQPGVYGEDTIALTLTDSEGATDSQQVKLYSAWKAEIVVSTDNGYERKLSFGLHPAATDGFDSGIDEPAPPPPPAGLDAAFVISGLIDRLQTDMRGLGDPPHRWILHVRSPRSGFTLRWDLKVSRIPDGPYIGMKFNGTCLNMTAANSRHFDPGEYDIEIAVTSLVEVQYNLRAGWNMISFPGPPADPSPDEVFAETSVMLPLYTWDPEELTYKPVNSLEPLKGYWVLSLQDEAITVQLTDLYTQASINLKPGWNMIGSLAGQVDFRSPQSDPAGSVFAPAFFWDPLSFSYIQADRLEPYIGYWVLSLRSCVLKLSITQAGSAPAHTSTTDLSWSIRLKAENPSGYSAQLVFGTSPIASGGFDMGLDLPSPPPPPTPNGLDAYFVSEGAVNRLMTDIRSSDNETWELLLESLESGLRLSWDTAELPKGKTARLYISGREIDMGRVSSCDLPPGRHRLIIKVTDNPIPQFSSLLPNYPNPFNPDTWIPFQLREPAEVTITIYDLTGKVIRRLSLGHREPGYYLNKDEAAYWDGRDERGQLSASGIYFVELRAGKFRALRKIVLLK